MINPEQMKNRRLKISDVHWVSDDVVGKFIRFTVNNPTFNPTAGHPYRKTPRMMISTIVGWRQSTL